MLRLVILLAAGLALFAFSVWRRSADPHEIARLLSQPTAQQEWIEIVRTVVADLVAGTRFVDHWKIMEPPDGERLTFALFDSRQPGPAVDRRYLRNCSYVGSDLLVVCDVALFDRFLADRDLDKRLDAPEGDIPTDRIFPLRRKTDEEMEKPRRELVRWVLGHEVGHIVANHGARHFSSDGFEQLTSARSLLQQNELEADAFLVERFRDPYGANRPLYDFLLDMLVWEIRRKACPDRSPLQHCPNMTYGVGIPMPASPLSFSTGGSHPEYLIRLLRLVNAADRQLGFGESQLSSLARKLSEELLTENDPASPGRK